MIIPLVPEPATPAAAPDAPIATAEFALALAQMQLVPTAPAEAAQGTTETGAAAAAPSANLMDPLATSGDATALSWLQQVAPPEPTIDDVPTEAPQPRTTEVEASPTPSIGHQVDGSVVPDTAGTTETTPSVAGTGQDVIDLGAGGPDAAPAPQPRHLPEIPETVPMDTSETPPEFPTAPVAGVEQAVGADVAASMSDRAAAAVPSPAPTTATEITSSTARISVSGLPETPSSSATSLSDLPIETPTSGAADFAPVEQEHAESPLITTDTTDTLELVDAVEPLSEAVEMVDTAEPTVDVATEAAPLTHNAPVNTRAPQLVDAATLQRVEAALEQLENMPPPRSLVLDLAEEGVRIRISSGDDGLEVDVQSEDGGEGYAAWEENLRDSLAQRGFQLSQQAANDQQAPDESSGPATTDAVRPTDDALRI